MTKFTIGSDPEVFVKNKKDGSPASAYGLLPGTKEKPHKTDGGAIQVDGMAGEFNTDPVSLDDFTSFNTNIIKQIRQLRTMLPDNLTISITPVQEFGEEFLATQPEEAKELGCDPDYSAYTLEHNPTPDGEAATFRTGAGHVHIGWGSDIPVDNKEHIEICANFVKTLDLSVGLWMTAISPPNKRAELYGKAGAMRPKPYGVEYRTPSNIWIKNKSRRETMFKLLNHAILVEQVDLPSNVYWNLDQEFVRDVIDNGDTVKAVALFKKTFSYLLGGNLETYLNKDIEEALKAAAK